MVQETGVQSKVESYQRLKKWYMMPPCLALSTLRWGSRVKWSNPGNGVARPPLHVGVEAIEKGAFGSPSTKVTNFTYFYTFESFFYTFFPGVWVTAAFASLQDSSQYSGRSQQYCSLNGRLTYFYFLVSQFLCQSFGECTERTNYNLYHRHFHVPQFFQIPSKVLVLIFLFVFF